MKKFLLTVFFVLMTSICFAEIEIYCPNCEYHIYTYLKDKIIKGEEPKAKDFRPAVDAIKQPKEYDLMRCPICDEHFEGYDYSCWKNGLAMPIKYFPAYTFLTKDEEGKFYWTPFDIGGIE